MEVNEGCTEIIEHLECAKDLVGVAAGLRFTNVQFVGNAMISNCNLVERTDSY